MLFLGLGTGLGTALIVEGVVAPMEVSHLPYKERDLRELCRPRRPRTRRQEEVAASRRRRRRPPHHRVAARRYGDRWRQCQEAQSPAAALSPGGERQRLQRRLSLVGRGQRGRSGYAALSRRTQGVGDMGGGQFLSNSSADVAEAVTYTLRAVAIQCGYERTPKRG
jgi:hypothetical protein